MTDFSEKRKLIKIIKDKDWPQRAAKILNRSVIKSQRGYSVGTASPMRKTSNFTHTVSSFDNHPFEAWA